MLFKFVAPRYLAYRTLNIGMAYRNHTKTLKNQLSLLPGIRNLNIIISRIFILYANCLTIVTNFLYLLIQKMILSLKQEIIPEK
jgi:hypothetical protein